MRYWIVSAQDRDYWRGYANLALNLRVLHVLELIKIIDIHNCQPGWHLDNPTRWFKPSSDRWIFQDVKS